MPSEHYKKVKKHWKNFSGAQHCMVFLGNNQIDEKSSWYLQNGGFGFYFYNFNFTFIINKNAL